MPNMLAHIGVQTLVTRAVIRGADVKWIWAGCVIPDLPWIGQRLARGLSDVSLYDLRLYAIVQATLLFALTLSAALACFSVRPGRVFAILGLGCLMHLVIDAAQTKWANGVHLFAPVSWEMLNFGLFWPEDTSTWVLTGVGLVLAAYAFWRLPDGTDDLVWPRRARLAALAALVLAYLAGPLMLMSGPLAADNHFVATLMAHEARPGRVIEIDRNRVVQTPEGPVLLTWAGERVTLKGALPDGIGDSSTKLSVRGRFRDATTIDVAAAHIHPLGPRNFASYLGLALVMAWWGRCLLCSDRSRLPWTGRE